jgi:hypothetical protein
MTTRKDSKATIKIPRPLYNRLKQIIDDSGFDSVTDFVVYVLRDIASNSSDQSLSSEEIEMVRQRLKRLGYF